MTKYIFEMPEKHQRALISACFYAAQKLRDQKENPKIRYEMAMLSHGLGILKRDSEQPKSGDKAAILSKDFCHRLEQIFSHDNPAYDDVLAELIDYVDTKLSVYNPQYLAGKPEEMRIEQAQIRNTEKK